MEPGVPGSYPNAVCVPPAGGVGNGETRQFRLARIVRSHPIPEPETGADTVERPQFVP